jgi:hypothetical protein
MIARSGDSGGLEKPLPALLEGFRQAGADAEA